MDMDRRVLWFAGAGIALVLVGRSRSSPDAAGDGVTRAVAVSSTPAPGRSAGGVDRAGLAELGARIAVARRDDGGRAAEPAAAEDRDEVVEELAESWDP